MSGSGSKGIEDLLGGGGGKPAAPKPETPEQKAKREAKSLTLRTLASEKPGHSAFDFVRIKKDFGPAEYSESDAATISADDPSKDLVDGIYRRRPPTKGYNCDILVENGKARPIPFNWDSEFEGVFRNPAKIRQEQKEAYSQLWDFIALKQGATAMVVDFPSNVGKLQLSKEKMIDMIEQQLELAEEKEFGLELGPRMKGFLYTLDPATRDKLIERCDRLKVYEDRNKLLYKTNRKKSFEDLTKAFEDNPIETDNSKLEKKVLVEKSTDGGGVDFDKTADKIAHEIAELNKQFDKDEENSIAKANHKIITTLNAYQDLLAKPEQLDKLPPIKETSFLAKVGMGLLNLVREDEIKLKDPNELIGRIEKLNDENYDSREKLINATDKQIADLKTQIEEWEKGIKKLKEASPIWDSMTGNYKAGLSPDDEKLKTKFEKLGTDLTAAKTSLDEQKKALGYLEYTDDHGVKHDGDGAKNSHASLPKTKLSTDPTASPPSKFTDAKDKLAQKLKDDALKAKK